MQRRLPEAEITVNGRRLTEEQSKAIRMALYTLELTLGQYPTELNAGTRAAAREVIRDIEDTPA